VHYAITFRAANGLLPDASGIGLSMLGVAWGPGSGDNDSWAFYDDTTGLTASALASYAGKPATPNKPDNPGPAFATPSTGDGFRAAPGDIVTVATDGTVNPSGPGTHTLTVYTSGDPATVAIPVALGRPVAPALAVLDLSSPLTGAKNVAFALTFVSHDGLTANWSSISLDFAGFTWPAGVGTTAVSPCTTTPLSSPEAVTGASTARATSRLPPARRWLRRAPEMVSTPPPEMS
jgi:hypothetical protein